MEHLLNGLGILNPLTWGYITWDMIGMFTLILSFVFGGGGITIEWRSLTAYGRILSTVILLSVVLFSFWCLGYSNYVEAMR